MKAIDVNDPRVPRRLVDGTVERLATAVAEEY